MDIENEIEHDTTQTTRLTGGDPLVPGGDTLVAEGDLGTVIESAWPEAVVKAADGEELSEPEVIDVTEWLMASEDEGEPEYLPTTVSIEIAPGRKVGWKLRPLTGPEFDQARKLSMGSKREQQQKISKGMLADLVNEREYQAYIVAFATVEPDLLKAAKNKNQPPHEIVKHRFRYKPGYIAELAAVVNDISGYDPSKVEVAEDAAGNS